MTVDFSGTSWGPATVLTVLLVLAAGIGAVVQVVRGEMTFDDLLRLYAALTAGTGLLGIGRGIARGGPGTGFATPPADDVVDPAPGK